MEFSSFVAQVATYSTRIRERAKARAGETLVYIILALLISSGVILRYLDSDVALERKIILKDNYLIIVVSSMVILGPIIFDLVFGSLPLETLRLRNMSLERRIIYEKGSRSVNSVNDEKDNDTETSVINNFKNTKDSKGLAADKISKDNVIVTLEYYASSSRALSNRIFSRAGVYLIIGALVAFSGLLFFYLENIVPVAAKDIASAALVLVPRLGILLFIELIAFFFLRQYRTAMDEFRYYESIQRKREEMVFALIAYIEKSSNENLMKAVERGTFSSKIDSLAPGYSTEHIETRRVEGNDMEGLAKIFEGLAAFKK